jgi:hypothetical protein
MDIVESLTARPGQTQESRPPEGLAPHFVDLEERSARELLEYAQRLARELQFIGARDGLTEAAGDWAPFFAGALPPRRDGSAAPHLALFAAFLKLYRIPRSTMNGITARHLEFFYRRVLGFSPLPPRPDRAHLLVELKKGAAPTALHPGHAFSAGKDASGAERLYAPLAETVIQHARVEALRSVFADPADGGTVRFAPRADSADGLGGALEGAQASWPPFGHAALPAAPIGFALAAPVLRLKEGERQVTLTLELDSPPAPSAAQALQERFECFLTGAQGWLGPYLPEAALAGSRLTLRIAIGAGEDAVVDYDPAKHRHAFATRAPVLQVLLRDEAAHRYSALRPLVVRAASLEVEAAGVRSLELESDAGPLDARRAFQPFGPQPVPGSRFLVGCAEALSKRLAELTLELYWLGLPEDFDALYAGYDVKRSESDFTVDVALRDATGQEALGGRGFALFRPREQDRVRLRFAPGAVPSAPATPGRARAQHIRALVAGGSAWTLQAARREWLRKPVLRFEAAAVPPPRAGFITLSLTNDFRHAEYRARLLQGRAPAFEPYTPALREIVLSYKAASGTAHLDDEAAFAGAEVEFFHVGAFGQRREHAWLRRQLAFVDDPRVPLLPAYEDEGELLIGLSGLAAGDSVSLLFKVAEGSADPDADQQPLHWAVLCDNYWKPLASGDALRDGTDGLLATGIVHATIPPQAGTLNSMLPAGLLWLKAAVRRQAGAVCALVAVAANAVEVERRAGGDSGRLWTPLPAGGIARLKTPVASVKSVAQPFASFGGTTLESQAGLNLRAAERLRHRGRCISAWDYERSVLAAFPEVRRVKCLPHSAANRNWLAPGRVLVVVVPDLRLRNAVDRLQPRVDAGTLSRIERHLRPRAPMRIEVQARNPRYERVRLDFRLRLRPGFEFNYYSGQVREALVAHLSPWAHDPGREISFGGVAYKSALLDFVEELPYVDYLTDFRMYHLRGMPEDAADVSEARATAPDAILVSDATHDIRPVP